jgi:hypothetical protein
LNGPLAIAPSETPPFKTWISKGTIPELNNQIIFQTTPDYSSVYDLKNFPKNVPLGKRCVSCHNGIQRNPFTFAVDNHGYFDNFIIYKKVVIDKTMPPDAEKEMTIAERKKIVTDIEENYYTALAAWLTENKCVDESGKNYESPP